MQNFKNIISKLKELKESDKLKPLNSLDEEILSDIRYSINPLYSELSEIFGISTSGVSNIFSRRKITGKPMDRINMFRKYGFKKIDMEEFIKYLTV